MSYVAPVGGAPPWYKKKRQCLCAVPHRMVHNAAFLLANYMYKFSSHVTYSKAAGALLVQLHV